MPLVDDLLLNTGFYIGPGRGVPAQGSGWVGRLAISALPGRSGVTLDYEATSPEHLLQHREHSMLAHSSDGGVVLLVAFNHDGNAVLLHELEPGFFAKAQSEPHREGQLGIRIEVPEQGRVRHAYCRVAPDGTFSEFDVADLRLVL